MQIKLDISFTKNLVAKIISFNRHANLNAYGQLNLENGLKL